MEADTHELRRQGRFWVSVPTCCLRAIRYAATSLALIIAVGCSDRAQQVEQVASIDGVALARADLIAEARRRSGAQRSAFEGSALARKETLERLIRHRLLLAEARRRGLHQEPALRQRIEEILVTALLRAAERGVGAASSDADIVAEIDRLRAERTRPERVRATVVWLTSEAAAHGVYAILAKEVRKVRQLAVTHPGSGSLKSGDTGFLSPSSGGALEAVRKVAAALPRVGAVAKPARVGDVWAVVVKTGLLPAMRLDDAVLRRLAEQRLRRGQGQRASEKLAADLRARADVQIDDAALAAGDWRLDEADQADGKGSSKR